MGFSVRRRVGWMFAALWLTTSAMAATASQHTSPSVEKRRVLVLTDIGNEPDDSESFVRFLLYTDQMDVEGLVATTSTWQRDRIQPQLLRERVAAYAKVLPNLRRHSPGYPDAKALMAAIRDGSSVYGMAGVGAGKDTDGSRRIIEVVDRPDPRPVFVSVWGGAADLAQALWTIRATRTPEQVKAFVAKLRVYAVSDQDDAGPWIRRNFPDLFYIASVHGWNQYANAAWTGISGDVRRTDQWPWADRVANDWLEKHVRRGPLGQLYPPHLYLMEGDTPSFLGLIANGLNDPEHPEWGGWGGRYTPAYEGAGHRADSFDRFADPSGRSWYSNQATIFRWRGAFQNDFAARIGWTLTGDVAKANHNPALVLNGIAGSAPVRIRAGAGEALRLSAAGSRDSDGDGLTYRWYQYAEPSELPARPTSKLEIAASNTADASIMLAKDTAGRQLHVVLEVQDDGTPALTSYRRAIIDVAP